MSLPNVSRRILGGETNLNTVSNRRRFGKSLDLVEANRANFGGLLLGSSPNDERVGDLIYNGVDQNLEILKIVNDELVFVPILAQNDNSVNLGDFTFEDDTITSSTGEIIFNNKISSTNGGKLGDIDITDESISNETGGNITFDNKISSTNGGEFGTIDITNNDISGTGDITFGNKITSSNGGEFGTIEITTNSISNTTNGDITFDEKITSINGGTFGTIDITTGSISNTVVNSDITFDNKIVSINGGTIGDLEITNEAIENIDPNQPIQIGGDITIIDNRISTISGDPIEIPSIRKSSQNVNISFDLVEGTIDSATIQFTKVVETDGQFGAIATISSVQTEIKSNDGLNWTAIDTNLTNSAIGISATNGKIFTFSETQIQDVSTGDIFNIGSSRTWIDVVFYNDEYYLIAENGDVSKSDDLIIWSTPTNDIGTTNITGVTIFNNKLIVLGYAIYTFDGFNWVGSLNDTSAWRNVAKNSNTIVATRTSSDIAVSNDGTNWTSVTFTYTSLALSAISWNPNLGVFVLISSEPNVYISIDGIDWILLDSINLINTNWVDIIYSSTRDVMHVYGDVIGILINLDTNNELILWRSSVFNIDISNTMIIEYDSVYTNKFYAVNLDNKTLYTSENGINWESIDLSIITNDEKLNNFKIIDNFGFILIKRNDTPYLLYYFDLSLSEITIDSITNNTSFQNAYSISKDNNNNYIILFANGSNTNSQIRLYVDITNDTADIVSDPRIRVSGSGTPVLYDITYTGVYHIACGEDNINGFLSENSSILYISREGGNTFCFTRPQPFFSTSTDAILTNLIIENGIAMAIDGGGVYTNTPNFHEEWSLNLFNNSNGDIAYLPNSQTWFVADNTTIQSSTDNGVTWNTVFSNPNFAPNRLYALRNANSLYATQSDSSGSQTVVHFNGSSWFIMNPPFEAGEDIRGGSFGVMEFGGNSYAIIVAYGANPVNVYGATTANGGNITTFSKITELTFGAGSLNNAFHITSDNNGSFYIGGVSDIAKLNLRADGTFDSLVLISSISPSIKNTPIDDSRRRLVYNSTNNNLYAISANNELMFIDPNSIDNTSVSGVEITNYGFADLNLSFTDGDLYVHGTFDTNDTDLQSKRSFNQLSRLNILTNLLETGTPSFITNNDWDKIASDGNGNVIMSSTSIQRFAYSNNHGIQWTENTEFNGKTVTLLKYENNKFIVVAIDGGNTLIYEGTNGSNLINSNYPQNVLELNDINTYANNTDNIEIFANTLDDIRVSTTISVGGIEINTDTQNTYRQNFIGYNDKVLISDGLDTNVLSLRNGVFSHLDVEGSSIQGTQLYDLIKINNLYVILGSSTIFTSVNGNSWNSLSNALFDTCEKIKIVNGFIVLLGLGKIVYSNISSDLLNIASWSENTDIMFSNQIRDIIYSPIDNKYLMMTFLEIQEASSLGGTFQVIIFPTAEIPKVGIFAYDLYIVLFDNGDIYTSEDAIVWNLSGSFTSVSWSGIAINNDVLIAISESTTVATSTDGLSWNILQRQEFNSINDNILVSGLAKFGVGSFSDNNFLDLQGTDQITNLAEPKNDSDASTKKYVDDKINEMIQLINQRTSSLSITSLSGRWFAIEVTPTGSITKADTNLPSSEFFTVAGSVINNSPDREVNIGYYVNNLNTINLNSLTAIPINARGELYITNRRTDTGSDNLTSTTFDVIIFQDGLKVGHRFVVTGWFNQ